MKIRDISTIVIHIILILMFFSPRLLSSEILDNELYGILWYTNLSYLLLCTIVFTLFCLGEIFTNNKVIKFFDFNINFKSKEMKPLIDNKTKQDIKSEFDITIE